MVGRGADESPTCQYHAPHMFVVTPRSEAEGQGVKVTAAGQSFGSGARKTVVNLI